MRDIFSVYLTSSGIFGVCEAEEQLQEDLLLGQNPWLQR